MKSTWVLLFEEEHNDSAIPEGDHAICQQRRYPTSGEYRIMWDFYPLKPPRWPSSAHIWEAPGSPKYAPVPPSYSACRSRSGRKYSPDLIWLAMGYGKKLSYPGRVN
ncbi:jg11274 [Pararge aegeria aegeria]|uniref:Jg11274 protein n=1 Tax=Pararge aegeria aegeria TaxID=348720 RepID=A0A8S4RLC1_9NEOP|nr:jg11274 [Pararge aegeria aegeria]